MPVLELMPLIIPAVLLQVLIQAYYIKHCWENPALTNRQKAFWLTMIILFNIIAAAVYLIATKKKVSYQADLYVSEMTGHTQITIQNNQVLQAIFVFLIVSYEVLALRMIFVNLSSENLRLLAYLAGFVFMLMLTIGFFSNKIKSDAVRFSLPVLQLVLTALMVYLDHEQSSQMLVLTLIAVLIIAYPSMWSRIYSAAFFAMYLSLEIFKAVSQESRSEWFVDDLISRLYADILILVLVFTALYLLKRQFMLNSKLEAMLKITQEQADEISNMRVLSERQRVVGEIHDTVGHTLTTAIIALEAADTMMPQNPTAARNKYQLASRQIKQGLHDLRHAIHTMQQGDRKSFSESVQHLMDEISQTTDLRMSHVFEIETEPLPIQQRVLLSAIKEFITNSLKHGDCQSIDILLQEFDHQYHLIISDDGKGTDQIVFGFGLQAIRNRTESLGGRMTAESQPGEGFSIHIALPSGQKTSEHTDHERITE